MADRLRILVLDDNRVMLDMLQLALGEAGFEVHTADSLMRFEVLLRSAEPHLVLTDIRMPDISGADVCRVLKSKMDSHLVPVVLMSSIELEELQGLAESSGADGWVSKNAGPAAIVGAIRRLTDEIVF